MVSTTLAIWKTGVLCPCLVLFALGVLGCSNGEGPADKLTAVFSFGNAKHLNELQSKNLMVKKNAIYYLGKKGEEKAVPLLIDLLDPNQPKNIRLTAVIALGKIRQAASADSLIRLLEAHDDDLRGEAIWALGQIKEPKAIPRLARLMDDDKVRLTAIWAMGNIGDESAVPILTTLLSHEDKFVRHNAAQSLKKIGNAD